MPCPACGHPNPSDHSLCFICGHVTATTPAPSPAPVPVVFGGPTRGQRRAYVARLADEASVVRLLRLLYLLYAIGLVLLTLSALVAGEIAELPGPVRLLLLLQPTVSLALVLLALRRLETEPFTWALVMAGLETLALFQEVLTGTWKSPHTIAAFLLWAAVFACARTASFRRAWAAGRHEGVEVGHDLRLAGALLLLYGGAFALLLLVPDLVPEGWRQEAAFYGGLVLVGVVAGLLAGNGVLRRSLCFGLRAGHLLPTLVALLVLALADTVWLTWSLGAWVPEIPELAWPGLEILLLSALAPGLFEEWQCRGVMWACVRERVGVGAAVLATATLFALMHGLGRGGLSAVIPQLFAGVVLGVLRARTGSLLPCMVVHALGNLYVFSLSA